MSTLQFEPIEQSEEIVGEVVHRVRAGGNRRIAVTSRVVPDDPKACGERGYLRVPHPVSSTQGVGQHHSGSVRRKSIRGLYDVMDFDTHGPTTKSARRCGKSE